MRDIDPVVIERVADVTLKTKLDDKLEMLVADIKLKVVTNSSDVGRLAAMMEAKVPLQVIISTRQRSFIEPSEQPGFKAPVEDDILGS